MADEKPKILAFAGSLRQGSLNKKALAAAVPLARAAGAEVTVVDLADLPMPVYDGDLEGREGLPENARKLKALMKAHEGFLICTPEYNSSIPGPLKNVIDWTSRPEGEEPDLVCYRGKTAGLMSASPGALGGLRALFVVREMLQNIGTMVIPQQVAIPKAHEAFGDDGALLDAARLKALKGMTARLVEVVRKLH